jgi:hypothetical protein
MSKMTFEAWKTKYTDKLLDSSHVSKQNNECRLWHGYIDKKYGMINVDLKVLGKNKWKRMPVHRMSFFLSLNSQDLTLIDYEVDRSDVSHLCNNPLCINPSHLSFELHTVNNKRIKCRNKILCSGHDPDPDCLLALSLSDSQWYVVILILTVLLTLLILTLATNRLVSTVTMVYVWGRLFFPLSRSYHSLWNNPSPCSDS